MTRPVYCGICALPTGMNTDDEAYKKLVKAHDEITCDDCTNLPPLGRIQRTRIYTSEEIAAQGNSPITERVDGADAIVAPTPDVPTRRMDRDDGFQFIADTATRLERDTDVPDFLTQAQRDFARETIATPQAREDLMNYVPVALRGPNWTNEPAVPPVAGELELNEDGVCDCDECRLARAIDDEQNEEE
jgi:hypothetical protein